MRYVIMALLLGGCVPSGNPVCDDDYAEAEELNRKKVPQGDACHVCNHATCDGTSLGIWSVHQERGQKRQLDEDADCDVVWVEVPWSQRSRYQDEC